MRIPAELRSRLLRTQAPSTAYFAAAKASASQRVNADDASRWCEVAARLDLAMVLALSHAFDDPYPIAAFLQVIRLHRQHRDSERLREADRRLVALATEHLALQGLSGVLGVDDISATTPRPVAFARRDLPEMETASRVSR